MSNEKTRKQQTLVIAIVAMIAISGLGYSLYSRYYVNASTTVTQLKSNNSGSTATVFQALNVNDTDGRSYWVYAPSQYQAMSVLGYETGASTPNVASISNVQTCIFITPTLADLSGVTKWDFTCLVTIMVVDTTTGKSFGDLVKGVQIAYTATSLTSGLLQEVISATSSGSALQTALSKIGASTGTYAYTIYLTEIGLTIHFQDGTTAVLTAPTTALNFLTWDIQIT